MKVNDNISFEYEERCMINETVYYDLLEHYSNYPYQDLNISNTYYDCPSKLLTSSGMVLRKRNTNGLFEITLKIKCKDYDKEINHPLKSDEQLKKSLNNNMISELNKLDVEIENLNVVGKILVKRREVQLEDCLLVIDFNQYSGINDYNIEIEASSREKAKTILDQIIKKYGIVYDTDYLSKSRRAICSYKK